MELSSDEVVRLVKRARGGKKKGGNSPPQGNHGPSSSNGQKGSTAGQKRATASPPGSPRTGRASPRTLGGYFAQGDPKDNDPRPIPIITKDGIERTPDYGNPAAYLRLHGGLPPLPGLPVLRLPPRPHAGPEDNNRPETPKNWAYVPPTPPPKPQGPPGRGLERHLKHFNSVPPRRPPYNEAAHAAPLRRQDSAPSQFDTEQQ